MLNEAVLRRLAAKQHGVASRTQLLQVGLTPRMVRHRIASGRWVALGRNVVALGPVPTDIWGRAQAGVLAVPSATVSHRTAGALHGLPGLSPATRAPIDLSTTVLSAVGPADVRLFRRTHRPRFQHLGGMAITTVPQTLFDLAAVLPVEELDRVVDLSLAQRRLPLSVLELSVEELSGRGVRGTPALRHLLASRRSEGGSESELERLFLEGWTAAGGVPGRQQVQMPWHARVDHLCHELLARFDRLIPLYYDPVERRRGSIEAKDRYGVVRQFPLMSVSIAGVGMAGMASFSDVATAAATGKAIAKAVPGSVYVRDGVVVPTPWPRRSSAGWRPRRPRCAATSTSTTSRRSTTTSAWPAPTR